MSRDGDEIEGIATLILAGGFFFVKGFRDLRLHRKIAGLATSKTRSMAMGLVELSGFAKSIDGNHLDPVYSRPCCYFNLKVEQYRKSGKRGSWVTIYEDSSDGKPFLCRDSTGEVTIIPAKPDLHFSTRRVQQNGLFSSCEPGVKNFLNARWNGWSSLRLTLDVLRDGEPFYVMGSAMQKNTVTRTDEVDLIFANTEKGLLSKLGPMAYLQIIGGGAALFGGIAWLLFYLKVV
jgi:hypothetical protein